VRKTIFYISILSILVSACSTDLNVVGDWKETTVVYGLLDQSQSKQYIKINKAFLGEGNAMEFAQIKDSVQFANSMSVKLVRLSDGSEYNLSPDNTIPKDPGTFYSGNQANAIYSFNSTGGAALNPNSAYKLVVRNSETGNEVTATTKLIDDFGAYTSPSPVSSNFGLIVASNSGFKFNVIWNSGANAKLYQLIMRLNYTDSTTSGNVSKTLDYIFPAVKTQKLTGGEKMEFSVVGQDYLLFIANQLSDYSGLVKRVVSSLDLIAIAGGEELNTYIEVNKPSTGIIQEKPEYTNIDNGLGIFSARHYKAPFSRPLSKATLDSLSGGSKTCHLKFTNILGVWPGCN